jgi:hypothetical protein
LHHLSTHFSNDEDCLSSLFFCKKRDISAVPKQGEVDASLR